MLPGALQKEGYIFLRYMPQKHPIIQHFTVLFTRLAMTAHRQNANVDVLTVVTADQLSSEVSILVNVYICIYCIVK